MIQLNTYVSDIQQTYLHVEQKFKTNKANNKQFSVPVNNTHKATK